MCTLNEEPMCATEIICTTVCAWNEHLMCATAFVRTYTIVKLKHRKTKVRCTTSMPHGRMYDLKLYRRRALDFHW